MKTWLKEFIQGLLSNQPGYSFGRFMSLLISAFVLGWDTSYIMIAYQWNHHLPPGVAPVGFLPDGLTLSAQIAFMTAFYGVTKYGDIRNGSPQAPTNS
jgi:hypothetical protein